MIQTPRRTYLLYADERGYMDEWVTGINTQLQNLKSPPPQSLQQQQIVQQNVGLDDFEMMTIIGQGSFGKVVQVRMKSTGDIFAMKVLNKKTIVERGETEHTKSEKNILVRLEHPFLMKLHYSFQTPDKLYFVMDYINGGELYYHLQKERTFNLERARFYAAEVTLAMEHLHNNGIIYRDLKPENILVDSEGHLKITDFGLAKEGIEGNNARTDTFCGTPEYLAPEIIEGGPYTKAVDWWSLGSLIFEMMTGLPPFYDTDVQVMYTKKMTTILEIPSNLDETARDIISRFLDKNPETRLKNSEEVKKHPFFAPIDWQGLYNKTTNPPYIPNVKSKESIDMIDVNFTNMNVKVELGDNVPQRSPDVHKFEGFTYIGKDKKV